MIILDTNYLIALIRKDLSADKEVRTWLQKGKQLTTSAVVWSEFLNGPLSSADIQQTHFFMEGRILPFGVAEAECAAQLYRAVRAKREHRADTFIAATAIIAKASLATRNRREFVRFVPLGLSLV